MLRSLRFPRSLALYALLAAACGGTGPMGDDDGDGGPMLDIDDEDDDTISDVHEGRSSEVDFDQDGTPDYLDDDSDMDGIPDYREAGDTRLDTPPIDSDSDSQPDFRDTDADENGRPDGVDGAEDFDGDLIGNYADLDDDGDAIPDLIELGDPGDPADFDMDGLPDFQDFDSDNDTIRDINEGTSDPDMDGFGAYTDDDADGDCIADSLEAGDGILDTPPRDTDDDSRYDFLDLDADNDGLPDEQEDLDCDGEVDAGESSPAAADTDGDGASDLIEAAAMTDPTDNTDNPQANGDFVFTVPYMEPPDPTEDTLDFSTDISQADVVFAMDTTGSMGQEIGQLRTSIVSLIGTIRASIPNTGFGVVDYKDFPTSPYGSVGDFPFLLRHRVMTTNTDPGLDSIEAAVGAYAHSGGNDGPESGWEALHQIATGAGTTAGGANVGVFDPGSAAPGVVPAGESVGTIGGVGFRAGSLPIIILITDACSHNSEEFGFLYSFSAAMRNATVTELIALSARVIAVISDPATSGCNDTNARGDANYAVNQTGALVPPTAWGSGAARPAGCADGQCCTGMNGAGEGTDGAGMCPLLFRVAGATGAGLGDSVARAVEVLTSYGTLDIGAEPQDDPSDAVDAVAAFVDRIEANPTAGAPCAAGLIAVDLSGDGVAETFPEVTPGTTVCFDVIPKMNTTVQASEEPQMFKATVVVEGDGVTTLDTRDVYFLVPPEIPDIPID